MTGTEYAVIAGVIFLAACLQASSGFGMGMLAAPVVALVDPALLPATLILLAFLVTVMVTVRERQRLDLRGTGWALAGRIPGSFLGAWLVTVLSREGLAWVVVTVVFWPVWCWRPRVGPQTGAAEPDRWPVPPPGSWAPPHPSADRPWPWSGKATRDPVCGGP